MYVNICNLCVCVCVCAYVCMYVCIHTHRLTRIVYVHIHTHIGDAVASLWPKDDQSIKLTLEHILKSPLYSDLMYQIH
jgi:hypothetical protein